ncbi:MAG: WecB/TagA/CpsF family glycosyltransferase, partial [Elusimicrobiota bacterium]|nr:WecB/TagA/CpsF family glycosyltransferase [Elusimicrobiota bacterium]
MPNKTKFLDIPVLTGDREGICEGVFKTLRLGKRFHIITLNALMVNHAFENPSFFKVLKSGFCVNDSVGIKAASFLLKGKAIDNFPGIELFYNLCAFAAEESFPVFVYGAKEDINILACEKLKKRFPGINICGRLNGYAANAAAIIKKAKPEFLFAALDSPRQELWLYEHLPELKCSGMGIGGALDVFSGHLRRANPVFRAAGFEWLARLLREPRRA